MTSKASNFARMKEQMCSTNFNNVNAISRWASSFCHHISTVLGLKWELRGREHLEKDQACIIVANHQSSLDVLGTCDIYNTFQYDPIQIVNNLNIFSLLRHVRYMAGNE